MPYRDLAIGVGLLALSALSASAQPVTAAKAGTIAKAEGQVFLNDQVVEESLTKFPDIKENGVVRTEEGRAEVLLTPGTILHLGENSSFRLITNRLIDTRLEMLTGSAVVDAEQIPKDTNVTVVVKDGTIAVSKAGHYRLDTDPARIKVYEGTADIQIHGQRMEVRSGKMLNLSGELALAQKFDPNDTDSLDNWARRRCELMAMANVSAAKSLYNSYSSVGSAGLWSWNPYFGLYTYIPGTGRFCDPLYGYCYWSPSTVNRIYYQPPPMYNSGNFGGGGFSGPSYTGMAPTAGGYSGTMAAASSSGPSVSSAPAAAASASGAASSAAAASAGHGSGGGGGRGH